MKCHAHQCRPPPKKKTGFSKLKRKQKISPMMQASPTLSDFRTKSKIEGPGGIGNKLLAAKENVVAGWIMLAPNGSKPPPPQKKKTAPIRRYACGNCENRERERERKVRVRVRYASVLLSRPMAKPPRCESHQPFSSHRAAAGCVGFRGGLSKRCSPQQTLKCPKTPQPPRQRVIRGVEEARRYGRSLFGV